MYRYKVDKRRVPKELDVGANYMPTPEEIAEITAEIRAGWTKLEYRRRTVLPALRVSFAPTRVIAGRRLLE